MKLFVTINMFLLLMLNCQSVLSQEKKEDEDVKNILKTFYTSYFQECSTVPNDETKINALLNKYCTPNLITQIKTADLDYDLLLDGQACDTQWLKTMVVSRMSAKENLYIVSYNYPVGNIKKTKKIMLSIKKNGNVFKIDQVVLDKRIK